MNAQWLGIPNDIHRTLTLAQAYRSKVERLLQAFDEEDSRSEAQELIRSLIDAVVLTPVDGVLHAEVKGDLATMLVL